jgi:predicted AlkP superfamily phosphohydrolase/phosphomutase
MSRVFMIGWDGATFDLIRPWVAEGKLPAIARLMREGVHGLLRSTMPPMTFPAWTTFLTGVNQGKHGIFDFTRQKPHSYGLEFVSGAQRRAPTFWRILSDAGRKVIALSIPCTFPPEPVNGVMISGMDAPGMAGHVDARGMHPPELYDELAARSIYHPISGLAAGAAELSSGRDELALGKILAAVQGKAATFKYLLTAHPWDCAMLLFGESDGVAHHYWKYCDPASPLFQDKPALRDSMLRVYQELDRQTDELLRLLPADTTVLMMSDHGFGGVTNWLLYPNCWLHEQGLLRFRGGFARWRSRLLDSLKTRGFVRLPAGIKRLLFRLSRRGLGAMESRARYGMIDWSGTQAYFEENPYYPVLWINLKGRQPGGTVEPGRPYEELRDRLIGLLGAWRHPDTGERIVEKVYRREELYAGPCVHEFPDIVVKWGQLRGYTYTFKNSAKSRDLAWLKQLDPHAPESLETFLGKSGHHRDDGILVARGAGIRQGATILGARLIDLAPTILHLQEVPVPAHMDGRVLEDLFTDAGAQPVAVQAGPAATLTAAGDNKAVYSADDEEKIAERLRALGYM